MSSLGDIDPYIDVAKQNCNLDATKVIPTERLKQFQNVGYTNQTNHHLHRMRVYSLYGKIDNADYDAVTKYSAIRKINLREFADAYRNQGNIKAQKNDQDCSTVDLRDKFGPIRDQDSIGWCYAFTAADLLGAKIGKRISAASLTMHGEKAFIRNGQEPIAESKLISTGGSVEITVKAGLKKGLCLEDDFPSEYFGNGEVDPKNILEFLKETENKLAYPGLKIESDINPDSSSPCPQLNPGDISSMAKRLSDLRDAVINSSTEETVFSNMEKKACDGKRFFAPNVAVKTLDAETLPIDQVFAQIDQQLTKKNPIGIAYFSGFLAEKSSQFDAPHASTIVGRAINPNTGICEYMVRNSWGSRCSSMYDEYRCSEGHFWITKGELHRHFIKAIYLE